jgi:hypothetical protein
MEGRTSEIVNQNFNKASPYENSLSSYGRASVLSQFEGKTFFIWSVPILLTLSEIIYLKHNHKVKADKISLFKWISYILAASASNFSTGEALRRTEYFTRLYPGMTKVQREQMIDAEITKRKYNI